MAILGFHGFEANVSNAELGFTIAGSWSVSSTEVRTGTYSFRCSHGTQGSVYLLRSVGTLSALGVCVAFRCQDIGSARGFRPIVFRDPGTNVQGYISFDENRCLTAYLSNDAAIGTSTTPIQNGVWTHIEAYWEPLNSGGRAIVWLNGASTPIIDYTGDTQSQSNSNIGSFRIQGGNVNGNYLDYFDDLIWYDSSTSRPLGDAGVHLILPGGNGNSSVLVGSDGNSTDNYALVDEATPNGDTDYVTSSTIGDKDTYAMGNLNPTDGSVIAIRSIVSGEKTDAGSGSIVPVYRSGSNEIDGDEIALSTSYQSFFDSPHETKPGGGAWTIDDVNAMELGVKVTA